MTNSEKITKGRDRLRIKLRGKKYDVESFDLMKIPIEWLYQDIIFPLFGTSSDILIFIALIASMSLACSGGRDAVYFISQPYTLVDNIQSEPKSPDRSVAGGENYNAMDAVVKDGLCVLYTPTDFPTYFSILDLASGEHKGEFGVKGNGPLEAPYFSILHELYSDGGNIKALVEDTMKDRCLVCNVTKTIEQQTPIYDTILPYNWRAFGRVPSFSAAINGDETFVVFNSIPDHELRRVVTPKVGVVSRSKQALISEFPIFCDSVVDVTHIGKWDISMPFSLKCAMSPNRNNVAIGMVYLPQINLLNITTGDLKCIRIKGADKVDLNCENYYYASVQCDDDFVYALCMNITNVPVEELDKHSGELHIFDWNGNLVKRWKFGKFYNKISIDCGKLYAFKFYSGTIDEYTL